MYFLTSEQDVFVFARSLTVMTRRRQGDQLAWAHFNMTLGHLVTVPNSDLANRQDGSRENPRYAEHGPGAYTLGAVGILRLASVGQKLMPESSPSLYASAVLVWLPRGELPDVKDFDTSKVQPPPTPNPHPWWLLHEAITKPQ